MLFFRLHFVVGLKHQKLFVVCLFVKRRRGWEREHKKWRGFPGRKCRLKWNGDGVALQVKQQRRGGSDGFASSPVINFTKTSFFTDGFVWRVPFRGTSNHFGGVPFSWVSTGIPPTKENNPTQSNDDIWQFFRAPNLVSIHSILHQLGSVAGCALNTCAQLHS